MSFFSSHFYFRNNVSLLNDYISQKGAKFDPNVVDSLGNSPLHYRYAFANLIASINANFDEFDLNKCIYLRTKWCSFRSAGTNYKEVTEILFDNGANPNIKNKVSGETPLHRYLFLLFPLEVNPFTNFLLFIFRCCYYTEQYGTVMWRW